MGRWRASGVELHDLPGSVRVEIEFGVGDHGREEAGVHVSVNFVPNWRGAARPFQRLWELSVIVALQIARM
jgi:hypothetical protein